MTESCLLRATEPGDAAAIVALNATVVAVTSPMDEARLQALLAIGASCTVVERAGEVIGFMLVMHDEAMYENGNFQWFSDRLRRFAYVDRIVIGDAARGLGLGRTLYDHLSHVAGAQHKLILAAEIDLVPANPGSMKFHHAYGFVELGQRLLDNGKIVSMQVKGLQATR